VIIVFVALVTRLGYLQVVQGSYYGRLADGNRIKLIPIMAPRGTFFDRNGVLLVSNRPGFTVTLVPLSGPIPDDVINRLAGILVMDPMEIKAKVEQQKGSFDPIYVKSDIGPTS
jgi:penicillin-binding protein 2